MKEAENRFPIEIIMLTYIIIYVMYIVTFGRGSELFFVFFILERLISFQYDEELDEYVGNVDPEKVSGKMVFVIVVLTFSQLGIFIYAFFKYPGLFMFLMIGELLDLVNRKLKKYIKSKR